MVTNERIPRGWRYRWQSHTLDLSAGGSLLAWQFDETARLYVSPASKPDRRLRGGLPVCWPWFGPAKTPGLPPHGFLQDSQFSEPQCEASEDRLTLTLHHQFAVEGQLADITLYYRLNRDGVLSVGAAVRNLGQTPLTFDIGFHPYLALPPETRTLAVRQGDSVKPLPRAIDEKWPLTASSLDLLLNGETSLTLTSEGFEQLGLWRIDDAKAQAIADLPDDACDDFFCLEPLSLGVVLGAQQQQAWQTTFCWHNHH